MGLRMSRFELPEGVSPTNQKPLKDSAAFAVPEVAAPIFARGMETETHAKTIHEKREVYERVVEEDDDDDDDDDKRADDDEDFLHGHDHGGRPNFLMLIFAIALLAAALAVIVIVNNRQLTPLCSTQPEWNQYNCRPG